MFIELRHPYCLGCQRSWVAFDKSSPLFSGRDETTNGASPGEGRYNFIWCHCRYPILTLDPHVRYEKKYASPGRGFEKESCFTLSDGLRVDVLRPHPPRPLRMERGPDRCPPASMGAFQDPPERDESALSPHSQPLRKPRSLVDHLVAQQEAEMSRGKGKRRAETGANLTEKERRALEMRKFDAPIESPRPWNEKPYLPANFYESKARHARTQSNPLPNLHARKSSADVLGQADLQSPNSNVSPTAEGPSQRRRNTDNISPTAVGPSRRRTSNGRREAFSFHNEEDALRYADDMRERQDKPYLHTDGNSAGWNDDNMLGRELTVSQAASMVEGQVSHWSGTSSTATRHRRAEHVQVRDRQDSKVASAVRKLSVAMRKMSDFLRTPAFGGRRKTVG